MYVHKCKYNLYLHETQHDDCYNVSTPNKTDYVVIQLQHNGENIYLFINTIVIFKWRCSMYILALITAGDNGVKTKNRLVKNMCS